MNRKQRIDKILSNKFDNFLLETGFASTDFPENFPEGSKIIIDDEQAFEISYGEMLLEKTLSGTLNCSSSNVLSYFVFGNSSARINLLFKRKKMSKINM